MSFLSRLLFRRTKVTHELFGKFFFEPPKIAEKVLVSTTGGNVVGFRAEPLDGLAEEDNKKMADVITFRGIPFATTVHRNRVSRPLMEQEWTEDRDCFLFGPACPQPPFGLGRIAAEGLMPAVVEAFFPPLPPNQSYSYGTFSEPHCLNVNVFTTSVDDNLRPVLVWIHGGACQTGSNIDSGFYDATRLATQLDACVVAINYRVNMFGFCHFPEEGIINLGTRDQIAALQWVQQNARQFGGDPNNVTILGESSGGTAVGTLLGSPLARGLFHKAVPMSLASLKMPYRPKQYEQTLQVLEQCFTKELQGQPLTSASLAGMTAQQIQNRLASGKEPDLQTHLGTIKLPFGPFCDGDVVPLNGPHSNLPQCKDIPILCGAMRDEWKLFTHLLPNILPVPKSKQDAQQHILPYLRMHFETNSLEDTPDALPKWNAVANDLYDQIHAVRAGRGQSTNAKEVFEDMATLLVYSEPMYLFARDTGAYHYTMELEDDPYKAAHARDFIALFQGGHPSVMPAQSAKLMGDWETKDSPMQEVSKAFIEAISSFTKTGQPSISNGTSWDPFPTEMVIKAGGCATRPSMTPENEFMQQLKKRVVDEFEQVDGTLII